MKRFLVAVFLIAASVYAEGRELPYATNLQACATFTPGGEALEVSVSSKDVAISAGALAGGMTSFRLLLPVTGLEPAREETPLDGCRIFLNRSADQAAIFVPYAVSVVDGRITGRSVALVRFDLLNREWHKPVVLDPPSGGAGTYLNTTDVVGYFKDTKKLVIARSNGHVQLLNEHDELIPSSDNYTPIDDGMQGFSGGMDAANNRRWSVCPSQKTLEPIVSCKLRAVSLLGVVENGLAVKAPRFDVAQWEGPRFLLFPSSSTLVFSGSPGHLFARNITLWVANLTDGSVRERGFPGHIHDDGMTGLSAISPDGKVLVFGVQMSTLAAPFVVDNYTSRGERLIIADVLSLRSIADVEPPNNEIPLAVAIDHRDHSTTLLVNWRTHWEYNRFPDK